MKRNARLSLFLCLLLMSLSLSSCQESERAVYKKCRSFLQDVYDTMDKNYYQIVDGDNFDQFIEKFNTKIYPQLRKAGHSSDYIRWRSAAYMIEDLKEDEDIFSAFYPPKPAQKYESQALGTAEEVVEKIEGEVIVRRALGIKGVLVEQGYKIIFIEPRSDGYTQGLREGHIIVRIGEDIFEGVTEQRAQELLIPPADEAIVVTYLEKDKSEEKTIEVTPIEFFKQQLFMEPVKIPGVYCLRMEHFNRKTFEDMFRYLKFFKDHGEIQGLILDLRGNPGGPPLAARQIASFFLPGGEEFAAFKRKGENIAALDVPKISEEYRYHGPMVVLINEESGSSSELFAGVLQKRRRAFLIGRNSAGQVMLKSMFDFDDGAMVLLVTARGHHPDGSVFSFEGLNPDKVIADENIDLLDYAAKFLYQLRKKVSGLMS